MVMHVDMDIQIGYDYILLEEEQYIPSQGGRVMDRTRGRPSWGSVEEERERSKTISEIMFTVWPIWNKIQMQTTRHESNVRFTTMLAG
jgi:hypothetical protein